MPPRFFADSIPNAGTFPLIEAEAHHLLHVLRLKSGDEVEVFNGLGTLVTGKIVSTDRRSATLQIDHRIELTSRPLRRVIATAVPKGDRADWLVEKLTELDVDVIQLLISERSVVSPRETKIERLRQIAISACKQSGRLFLPQIHPPIPLTSLLRQYSEESQLFVAHPTSTTLWSDVAKLAAARIPQVALVGPEGGFSDAELLELTQLGAQPVRLGTHVLRIETAACALAAGWELGTTTKMALQIPS